MPFPEASEKMSITSERRLATILFADISGFTSMSEKMDAELVTATMNKCFGLLGEIVERYGGTIDKFIGDCIMVLFGVPKAVEDSPLRAVQTALEMRDAIKSSRESFDVEADINIHIGINTGEVISGDVGSERKKEFTVMGDAVNVASRLKDAAPKGMIYVGSQTHHQTRDKFLFRALEPISLKGKESPVPAYELLSRKTNMTEGRMISSPLVGRQKELELLERQLLRAINGEGSIVSVMGEAGLGKSRLIAELRDKEPMNRVTLLEGRAQSFGKNLSYHPIIDLLKKWSGIKEEDGETESFRKLEQAIRALNPDDADEFLPFMATLMSLPMEDRHKKRMDGIVGDTLAKLMMRTTFDLLSRISRIRPLVLVLEDMHWADESTVEFVEYLLRIVEKYSVLIIIVFRPNEERAVRLSKTAREGYESKYIEIILHPLDSDGCAELIGNLLKNKTVPSNVTESISSRTGGNPYFVEEVMRAAIDEYAVEATNGGFKITERLQSFVVPSTVNEVIMSRFDRLDEPSRELLRIASVIGRTFFYRILTNIAAGVSSIDERIAELKKVQIILERGSTEEVEYLFKHALAQQAIYDSILLQVKKRLHISVAHAIESVFSERLGEFAGMLAMHYLQGEDYDKAEEYMIRAGEEAMKAAASAEAINYYREALDLYLKKQGKEADPAKVVMLKKNIARSLYYRGQFIEALPYYRRIVNYYGVLIPENGIILGITAFLGIIRYVYWPLTSIRWGNKTLTPQLREGFVLWNEMGSFLGYIYPSTFFLAAFATIKQLLDYDLSDFDSGLRSIVGNSCLFFITGISFGLTRLIFGKLDQILSRDFPSSWECYSFYKSQFNYISGEWTGYGIPHDPLFERQVEQGNAQDVINAVFFSGLGCIECGDWASYVDAQKVVEHIATRFDNNYGKMVNQYMILRFYIKRRMANEAYDEITRTRALQKKTMGVLGEIGIAWLNAQLSRIFLLRGDLESAEENLKKSAESMAKPGMIMMYNSFLLWAYAAVAVERICKAGAERKFDRKMRKECQTYVSRYLSNSRKFAPDRTEALKFAGSYWWYVGSKSRALKYWNRSIREGERLGAKVELGHTYMDSGKLLGDIVPGPEWRRRGVELYRELGIGVEQMP
jgi:class 3 adenylate cyclase/tetratricopeptide (TPR) repeat protein